MPELELLLELEEELDELLLEVLLLEVEEELELLLEEPSEPPQAESRSRPATISDFVVRPPVGAPKLFLNMFQPCW